MSDREFSGSSESAQAFLPGFVEDSPVQEVPNWRALAFAALSSFVNAQPGRRFLSEEFRASLPEGFPQPREPRNWGTILNDARRAGLIEAVGYKKIQPSATANARPMTLWEARS